MRFCAKNSANIALFANSGYFGYVGNLGNVDNDVKGSQTA